MSTANTTKNTGDKEFKILALSGGGYLGVYTAALLTSLEDRLGAPLAKHFDLVAGTSVGGILAVGLGFELPMARMLDIFLKHGTQVFSPRALPQTAVSRILDLTRSVMGPKYDGLALREALSKHLGDATLQQAHHHLVIPCVNISNSMTKVFKTPHATGSTGDETARAVDVAMATCAAPAFFPAVPIGGALFADGGMFAVAPDQVALHEAEHFMGISPERIRMLSIGTGTSGYQPAQGVDANSGAIGWLANGRLLLTLISVQQQHVQAMMEDRLRSRYIRLDEAWPAQAGLGIDVATRHSANVLCNMARDTLEQVDTALLQSFVS